MAPKPPAAKPPAAPKSTGTGLSKKIGPAPLWAWAVGGVAAIVIAYYIYKQHQAAAAQATAPAPADTTGTDQTDGGLAGSGVDTSGSDTGAGEDAAALATLNDSITGLAATLLTTDQQLEQQIALINAGGTGGSGGQQGTGSNNGTGNTAGAGVGAGAVAAGQAPLTPALGPVPDLEPNSASAQSASVHAQALQPGGGGRLAATG